MNDGAYPIPKDLKSFNLAPGGYSNIDYKHLKCRITGKFAEVVVGDAPEHRTKIDLYRHSLEYFDPDDATNAGVADLMRSIGLKCRMMEERGVFCSGVSSRNAVMVFRALVMVPSMDRRMEYCRNRHSPSECRKLEIEFFQRTAKKEK